MGAGGALAVENAHADRPRAGFFESFDLAEADEGGEFVTLAADALGGGRAAGHGSADDVAREIFSIRFEFRVSVFESHFWHVRKSIHHRDTGSQRKQILFKI